MPRTACWKCGSVRRLLAITLRRDLDNGYRLSLFCPDCGVRCSGHKEA